MFDESGVITILPKVPAADDEYTPALRRVIDRIAKGLEDIKKSRIHGPSRLPRMLISDLRAHAGRRNKSSLRKSP